MAKQIPEPRKNPLLVVLIDDGLARASRDAKPERLVGQQRADCGGQRGRIVWRTQRAVPAVRDEVEQASDG